MQPDLQVPPDPLDLLVALDLPDLPDPQALKAKLGRQDPPAPQAPQDHRDTLDRWVQPEQLDHRVFKAVEV